MSTILFICFKLKKILVSSEIKTWSGGKLLKVYKRMKTVNDDSHWYSCTWNCTDISVESSNYIYTLNKVITEYKELSVPFERTRWTNYLRIVLAPFSIFQFKRSWTQFWLRIIREILSTRHFDGIFVNSL